MKSMEHPMYVVPIKKILDPCLALGTTFAA